MAWDELAPRVTASLARDLKITPQQAAGIVGQLGFESEGLQAINERKPLIEGSRGGFGWAQWTGPRRKRFEKWAENQGLEISSDDANYGFLLHELTKTPEGRILDNIRATENAQDAGRIFTDGFLRPGIPNHEGRQSWTDKAMSFLMPAAHAGTINESNTSTQAKIQQAREAGYSDNEIMEFIQQNMSDNINKAREAGYSDDEIFQHLGLNLSEQIENAQPTDTKEGSQNKSFLQDLGRQVGLTARYGVEGVGDTFGLLTEPIRFALNPLLNKVGLPEAASTGETVRSFADYVGLPKPETPQERVVGDAARMMASGGMFAGSAGALSQASQGVASGVLSQLGSNAGQQLASAAGAGAAGGATREAGGGPLAQAGAALLGGVAAPMALSGGQHVMRNISGRFNSGKDAERVVRSAGVDWESLSSRSKQAIEAEVKAALKTGRELDPAAVRRLADFSQVPGTTPTRGMLSQDPAQITREQNLAKIQANSVRGKGTNLADIAQNNERALVKSLDSMGAADATDPFSSGQRIIEGLKRADAPVKANVDKAYQAVRDAQGRYATMDTAAFSKFANDALDEKQLGHVLPNNIKNWLNDVSLGKIPLNVNTAQQADSMLSGAAADLMHQGNRQGALAVNQVRNALENTPIDGAAGQAAQGLYQSARSAAASRFDMHRQAPAIEAALNDADPSKFVNQYILGNSSKTARVSHVQALADTLKQSDPQGFAVAKNSIAQHLKDKALSGLADDIGSAKFSATQYAKALRSIGDAKLGAFFKPQELQQLHAIGRVGRMVVNQPTGSAVNNSNTAAMMIGRMLDSLSGAGRYVPLGVGHTIEGGQRLLRNRAAQNLTPALTAPINPTSNPLIPASVYGSLLATTPDR